MIIGSLKIPKSIFVLFLIWIGLWSFEYWFAGPFSYVRFYDEADAIISRYLASTYRHLDGIFLHYIQGGGDYYGSFGSGNDYFDLERILFNFFPVWVAYLTHKLLVVTISLIGAWLLLRTSCGIGKFEAFCLATIVTVYNPYSLYSTEAHGIGYAVLPLAIYFYVMRIGQKNYFFYSTLLAVLIAISTSAIVSFPVIVAGLLLSFFFLKRERALHFLTALIVLVFFVSINNMDALYGYVSYGSFSARAIEGAYRPTWYNIFFGGWLYLMGKVDCVILGYRVFPILILAVIIVGIAAYLKERTVWKMVAFMLVCLQTSTFFYAFPWEKLDLPFVYSVNLYRLSYVFIIPLCLLAGNIIKSNGEKKIAKGIPLIFVFVSLSILGYAKKGAMSDFIARMHSLPKLSGIPNLVNREWEPKELYRVVTSGPYLGLHPNFLWAYGIETLDGYVNLIPNDFVQFWSYGVRKNRFSKELKLPPGGNLYIDYFLEEDPYGDRVLFDKHSFRDMEEHVDLNLLRMANVSHIISYVPLQGKNLFRVSGPDDEEFTLLWRKDTSRFKKLEIGRSYVFETPNVFVYRLSGYSQRAFFPSRIERVDTKLNVGEKYQFFSKHYQKNICFSEDVHQIPGRGQIQSIQEVPNGYRVIVFVTSPGVFVLNTLPMKFWKVYVDEKQVDWFPVSLIQLGINMEKGFHVIHYQYERPLLRDKIVNALF